MILKVPNGVESPKRNITVLPFIQTGNKAKDIKTNIPIFRKQLKSIFKENDLKDIKMYARTSDEGMKFLFGDSMPNNVEYVDSFWDILPDLDERCILFDDSGEVNGVTIKNNMHLISIEVPYKLDWDENNLDYTPTK